MLLLTPATVAAGGGGATNNSTPPAEVPTPATTGELGVLDGEEVPWYRFAELVLVVVALLIVAWAVAWHYTNISEWAHDSLNYVHAVEAAA